MTDELEARLRALEALVVDRMALDAPGTLDQLEAMVGRWPEGDERAQALEWIEDARRRFDEVVTGWRMPKP